MDFFSRQDAARKRTKGLVMLFALAVAALVVAVNLGCYVAATFGGAFLFSERNAEVVTLAQWFSGGAALWVSAATLLVIGLGSGVNWMRLSGGGKAVADLVSARRLSANTTDSDERRLMNVVEEMSIASGTPIPQVYVMDKELGINAFVAGLKNADTVLVVTKGTLTGLNRQELQGVIGHEYSHILHGDMRLNVHLLGVLAGILLIGQLGGFILRHMRHSRSSSKDSGSAVAAIAVVGVTLFAVGYLGLFFGRLIKASVSRQREFLADASAVQFTRDNAGIAGALAHIHAHSGQSLLQNAHAEDMSHMCFGETVHVAMQGMLATHPPLTERIKALGFSPEILVRQAQRRIQEQKEETTKAQLRAKELHAQSAATRLDRMSGAAVLASVGTVQPAQLAEAVTVLSSIPEVLMLAVHEPTNVSVVVASLMLSASRDDALRRSTGPMQIESDPELDRIAAVLAKYFTDAERNALTATHAQIERLSLGQRLTLLNVGKLALQQLSKLQRQHLLLCLLGLAKADNHFVMEEFVLYTLVRQWIMPKVHQGQVLTRFSSVSQSLTVVLGAVYHAANAEQHSGGLRWPAIMQSFGFDADVALPASFDAVAMDEALETLDRLSPMLKKTVVTALVDIVVADDTVTDNEHALLCAICERLNVPVPLLN